jgi:hypothetical protein
LAKTEELKMAEERLRLRHTGASKWGKEMRRFKGKMDNKDIREQYHDMIREKNNLKDRQQSMANVDIDSSEDSDENSEQSENEIRQ